MPCNIRQSAQNRYPNNKQNKMMPNLLQMIHAVNPYEGFDFNNYPLSSEGWYSEDETFNKLIDDIHPNLIIEVGTWKGASAIYMASYLKEKKINAQILCIDTWLGSVDFWTDLNDKEKYLSLNLQHGYPTVYYQFLANVMHQDLQDYIIPFPQSSLEAWRWLELNNIKADLCYIDASHNRDDVYSDLTNYWSILNTGGCLFGDDYDEYWPTVKGAVNSFVEEKEVDFEVVGNKWIIKKTKTENSVKKNATNEITELNKNLQMVQHDYLQYQKRHCDMRDRFDDFKEKHKKLQQNHRNSQQERKRLQEEYRRIQQEHHELQHSKAVRYYRAISKRPLLLKMAHIVDSIINRNYLK